MKPDIKKQALLQHKKLGGKITVKSKAALKSQADLSVYYTPGVGAVASYLHENPAEVTSHTIKRNTVAVISDGSAVLGLGNIGPEAALPVMEGKCMLFSDFAGVDAFPIVLNTQKTEEIIATIKNIAPGFGGINLEDIAAPRCFEIEERLKKELTIPVMHDDQHGTAIVVLAGLINACKVVKKSLRNTKVAVIGAGAAGTAITKLLLKYGVGDVVVCDSKGIVSRRRRDLDEAKKELAKATNIDGAYGDVSEAIIGADIVIGVSKPNSFLAEHIKLMNKKAIVFALANPTPEILPEEAKAAGAYVVATGRSDFPNQINNVLAFPGIFRGALDNGVREITDQMKIAAAVALARLVKKPTRDKIIPSPFDRGAAKAVAAAIK